MYNYQDEKPKLFSDEGQRMFLRIRDKAAKCLEVSGAVMLQNAISDAGGGDSWMMLACVDRMVELGELREVHQGNVAGQHRIFVASR